MAGRVEIGGFRFRFRCVAGCTACCEQPGEVYLTEEDRRRAADFLQLSVKEFERRYCEQRDAEWRLSDPAPRACHFLVDGGCAIHPAKPLQCRTFPFWPENVRTKSAWKRLSRYCPGVGLGEILPVEAVRGPAAECAAAFPELEG